MGSITTIDEFWERWRRGGRPARVVFTNGCFDLLHPGHTRYLADARKLGDCLIVGINDDDSVRRLKGPQRPFLGLAVRGELLAALASVNHVIPFSEDTPKKLIEALRPEVLVKGGDYSPESIVGADEVRGWGGEVHVLPLVEDYSTTTMAKTIANAVLQSSPEHSPTEHRPYTAGMSQDLECPADDYEAGR